jgi:hypothetical protein
VPGALLKTRSASLLEERVSSTQKRVVLMIFPLSRQLISLHNYDRR